MLISIFFFIIACIANAAMDTIRHHWNMSLFNYRTKKNPLWNKWWKSNWEDGYNEKGKKKFVTKYLPFISDGWHFCKAVMLCSFVIAISFSLVETALVISTIICLLILWFIIFEIFYTTIFVNRKYLRG